MELPQKKYEIIYADPPWSYKVWSKKGMGRSAENHYNTMDKGSIFNLDVSSISAKNSVLLLWATAPCLLEAIETIKAWGFTYKTVAFTWVKRNKRARSWFWGLGYYTRANPEFCLLATKGKPLPRVSRSVHSVVDDPVMAHSQKPHTVRERIVELFGDRPRIELFARELSPGWDAWGNEV